MLLYPAIDLMGGQAVRLRQGRAEDKTVYSDDPVSVALEWAARGGDWLHVVDLDAAFTGEQSNLELVRRMAGAIGIPVQLGGGIRDEAAIRRALDAGVARVVVGTRAAAGMISWRRRSGDSVGRRLPWALMPATDSSPYVAGPRARKSRLPISPSRPASGAWGLWFTRISPRMECCKGLI